MMQVKIGRQYGRLIALEETRLSPSPRQVAQGRKGNRAVRCRCTCPEQNETLVPLNHLVTGRTISCGCYQREVAAESGHRNRTHGVSKHELFGTWTQIMERCENPLHRAYRWYGADGVKVHGPWRDPAVFISDIERLLGPRPKGMTLDRWPDKEGNYEPDNVRWADWFMQARNRRKQSFAT